MHSISKLLTTAIIILALLSAGCTDMGGGSVESPTQDSTPKAESTQEPIPIDTPVEPQHLYDINPGYEKIVLEADENLFGIKIEGSTVERDFSGWETVYNDNEDTIFQRETYTPQNFNLYSELQPEQARALVDQYGSMKSVVMEQADTDGDGALDKVAVRYVGSKGTLEFERPYKDGMSVGNHIGWYLYENKL
ncbi:MAG: hypothetical protein MIO93_12425 [ANME-2 cluster archaeon]|nr:hypothetical protein [ANME-2 cluster archaeon]